MVILYTSQSHLVDYYGKITIPDFKVKKKKKECMVKNVSTFSGDSQLPNVRKVIELLTFCLGDQGPFYTIAQQLPQQFSMTCFYVESAKIKAFFFFSPHPRSMCGSVHACSVRSVCCC